jgi:hypothetical protein
MPWSVPCTNCLRFHYGTCYEQPKQCRDCGGINHIERYCPHRNQVTTTPGQPLPGTRAWCDYWNLNDDPEMKKKILNALKTNASSAIWVNNQCIYPGHDKHFSTREVPRGRGRPLEERVKKRSRSPPKDRLPDWHQRPRSRSPLRRYSPQRDQRRLSPVSLSPYRRQCSLSPPGSAADRVHQRRARSPRYACGSNAIGTYS